MCVCVYVCACVRKCLSTSLYKENACAYKPSITVFYNSIYFLADSFSYHDDMKFSTSDNDNDEYWKNCAQLYHGGFWFKDCSRVRLTGLYGEDCDDNQGILWLDWLDVDTHPQYADMKIKAQR